MLQTQEKQNQNSQRAVWRRPNYFVEPSKDRYQLRVFLPGVSKQNSSVTIEEDQLLVVGKRDTIQADSAKALYRELPEGDFRLHLQLNVDVDSDRIEAHSENGVLVVNLPVAEGSKPKAITVS